MQPSKPDHQRLEQAVQWFIVLSEQKSPSQQFIDWLNQDIENQQAWDYIQAVNARFTILKETESQPAIINTLLRSGSTPLNRRNVLKVMTIGTILPLLLASAYWHDPLQQLVLVANADYQSKTGEISHYYLDDGSQIWLNTASALNQSYTQTVRSLTFIAGEALFQTAPDPLQRHFIVDSPFGTMQALGTKFNVRLCDGYIALSVFEGRVAVTTKIGKQQCLVKAGETIHFTETTCQPAQLSATYNQDWHKGILVADEMTLGEVLEVLRRYRRGYLHYQDDVAELRIFGTLPLTDTDLALSMLEDALPIHIHRYLSWWVSIERQ